MSQGGYVTLIGFVAREPTLRTTRDGRMVADVRVGATTRFYDKATDQWRDGDTSYFTVNCWRRLAGHVRASLHKGDPVMVKGHFRTRTYEDRQNRIRTEVEITADTIGHDLSRGVANYMRPERSRQVGEEGAAAGGTTPGGTGTANEMGADEMPANDMAADEMAAVVMAEDVGAGDLEEPSFASQEPGEQLDQDEAAKELDRELDRGLAEDGQLAPL